MNAMVVALVIALAQAETPHGVPARPGPAGETGRWQLTPAVRADRGAELRARRVRITDEALATAQVEWLMRELARQQVEPLPFNIALAWNCGLTRSTSGRAPIASYLFAARVVNLMAVNAEQSKLP